MRIPPDLAAHLHALVQHDPHITLADLLQRSRVKSEPDDFIPLASPKHKSPRKPPASATTDIAATLQRLTITETAPVTKDNLRKLSSDDLVTLPTSASSNIPSRIASSDTASLIRQHFFNETASFVALSVDESDQFGNLSLHQRKLLLWQALLVEFGICAPLEGNTIPQNRASHLPEELLPLPESLNGCQKLLRRYAHVNLYDLAEANDKKLPLPPLLFPSISQLVRYTRKTKKTVSLATVKGEFLNPLLKTIRPKHLQRIDEENGHEEAE